MVAGVIAFAMFCVDRRADAEPVHADASVSTSTAPTGDTTTGPASTTDGGASCSTGSVRLADESVNVRKHPYKWSTVLFRADDTRSWSCSTAVKAGKYWWCGGDGDRMWIEVTTYRDFRVYVPASCMRDVDPS